MIRITFELTPVELDNFWRFVELRCDKSRKSTNLVRTRMLEKLRAVARVAVTHRLMKRMK